jgi:guanylate kinase
MSTGLLLVLSGPSGVGKTSIVKGLRHRLGGRFSVSATTRQRTASEVEGRDYFFVDEPTFQRMADGGEFLEFAQVFGRHRYGTPRAPVEEALGRGELIILDIDVQGAIQVRRSLPSAFLIFILPPDEGELLRRLRGRARDDEAAIQRRFDEARREIELARRSEAYDHFVVNDDLARATEEVCGLVASRRQMPARSAST